MGNNLSLLDVFVCMSAIGPTVLFFLMFIRKSRRKKATLYYIDDEGNLLEIANAKDNAEILHIAEKLKVKDRYLVVSDTGE